MTSLEHRYYKLQIWWIFIFMKKTTLFLSLSLFVLFKDLLRKVCKLMELHIKNNYTYSSFRIFSSWQWMYKQNPQIKVMIYISCWQWAKNLQQFDSIGWHLNTWIPFFKNCHICHLGFCQSKWVDCIRD